MPADPAIREAVLRAAKQYETAGARVEEIQLPYIDHAIDAYYILSCAEASSNMARYDGLKYGHQVDATNLPEMYKQSRTEGFGLKVKRRILLGNCMLSGDNYEMYFKRSQRVRTLVKAAYDDLLTRYDAILSPVAPTAAYALGDNIDDPMARYMGDMYTVSANLAGLPAMSIPYGADENGLPIGVQLIGGAFSEPTLVNLARILEI